MAKRIRTKFSVVSNAMNTQVKMATARDIRVLTGKLEPLIAGIRAGDASLKRELPAVCWAATFTDGKRHAESAEFAGLCFLDIDHVGTKQEVMQLYDEHFGGREEDLGIVHAQISPSGDGLHIVFIPRKGDKIEEMQQVFAQDSGITDYDRACKDISRMLFLSSVKDTLYDALDTLFDDVEGGD